MVQDMTHGSPTKLIFFFSIPLLIGNIFQQLYSMADTVIVGQTIGVQALAAVGATGAVSFLILGFVFGLTGGFAVITAQRYGARQEDEVRRSVAHSILLSAAAAVILTAGSMLLARWMLHVMNTPADLMEDAYAYIIVIFGGIGASFFYNLMSSILRALGDSKTPLYFLILASLLNIVLDLVLILRFDMGVAGAAWATVAAQIVAGGLCVAYSWRRYPILRLRRSDFKWDGGCAMQHLRVGIPMALQFSITAVGVMVLQIAINGLGSAMVAAYTAASKVEQLATQPMATFGVTMATFAAQNLGAGKKQRIREGVRKCTLLSTAFSLGGAAVVVLFGGSFVRLFISGNQPQVVAAAQTYLNSIAAFFVVLAVLFIYRNVLQGIGEGFVPMMAGVAELAARVITAFSLPPLIGYAGICIANPAAWVAAALPLWIAYRLSIRRLLRDSQS